MKYFILCLLFLFGINLHAQNNIKHFENLFEQYSFLPNIQHVKDVVNTGFTSQDFTHKLDSVITKDAFGSTIERRIAFYDLNGLPMKAELYGIFEDSTNLALAALYTYLYDGLDLPSEMIVETFDEATQQMDTSTKIELFYDDLLRIDSSVVWMDDFLTGEFLPFLGSKQEFEGSLLVQSRQWVFYSFLPAWEPVTFIDYFYNEDDSLVAYQASGYDLETDSFMLNTRFTVSYNDNYYRDSLFQFIWQDSMWIDFQRYLFSYYPNNVQSSEISQIHQNGHFQNNYWIAYPVENNSQEAGSVLHLWNLEDSTWMKEDSAHADLNPGLPWTAVSYAKDYTSIPTIGGLETVTPFYFPTATTDEVRFFETDTLNGQLLYSGKSNYYYSLIGTTEIVHEIKDQLLVYPNPTLGKISVQIPVLKTKKYKIFNLSGKLVQQGQTAHTMDLSNLDTGIYFIHIEKYSPMKILKL